MKKQNTIGFADTQADRRLCSRCKKAFYSEEMLYIGRDHLGSLFSCEGCMNPVEQNFHYSTIPFYLSAKKKFSGVSFNISEQDG